MVRLIAVLIACWLAWCACLVISLACLPARLAFSLSSLWFPYLWLVCKDCAWIAHWRSSLRSHGTCLICLVFLVCVECTWLAHSRSSRTIFGLFGLRRRRLARSLVELANSRFWVNFRKIVRKRRIPIRRFTFTMIFRKTSYIRRFWIFFGRSQNWSNF